MVFPMSKSCKKGILHFLSLNRKKLGDLKTRDYAKNMVYLLNIFFQGIFIYEPEGLLHLVFLLAHSKEFQQLKFKNFNSYFLITVPGKLTLKKERKR